MSYKLGLFLAVFAASVVAASASNSAPASGTAAGLRIAQQCKSCHSIGVRGASPNPASPPFRTLAQRYPLENLQESLVEGIVVGHAAGMPSVKLTPRQAGDFLRYLKSIQRK
ncbi:MAG: c-type cytochrome [Rhodoblastus sp.]|nr:c-type cytochrome [Rhodoblastus sp.]